MFEIPTLGQLVVQIAWLGLDEDAVNDAFERLGKRTRGQWFDVLGTDDVRARMGRFSTELHAGELEVQIDVRTIAVNRRIKAKPISRGQWSGTVLALLKVDAVLLRADPPSRELAELANAVRWPVSVSPADDRNAPLLVAALAPDERAERTAIDALGADATVFRGDGANGLQSALVELARMVIA